MKTHHLQSKIHSSLCYGIYINTLFAKLTGLSGSRGPVTLSEQKKTMGAEASDSRIVEASECKEAPRFY